MKERKQAKTVIKQVKNKPCVICKIANLNKKGNKSIPIDITNEQKMKTMQQQLVQGRIQTNQTGVTKRATDFQPIFDQSFIPFKKTSFPVVLRLFVLKKNTVKEEEGEASESLKKCNNYRRKETKEFYSSKLIAKAKKKMYSGNGKKSKPS